jgi:hypothetical protein
VPNSIDEIFTPVNSLNGEHVFDKKVDFLGIAQNELLLPACQFGLI